MNIRLIDDGVAAGFEKSSGVPDGNYDADKSRFAMVSHGTSATVGLYVRVGASRLEAVLSGVISESLAA
jgi:hypothetical protein